MSPSENSFKIHCADVIYRLSNVWFQINSSLHCKFAFCVLYLRDLLL